MEPSLQIRFLPRTILPGPGDKALRDMLSFHGVAMNGGVLHALQIEDRAAIDAAISGYAYFGFSEVSDFIDKAATTILGDFDPDELEPKLDKAYGELIPDDSTLDTRFEATLLVRPKDFAAV